MHYGQKPLAREQATCHKAVSCPRRAVHVLVTAPLLPVGGRDRGSPVPHKRPLRAGLWAAAVGGGTDGSTWSFTL